MDELLYSRETADGRIVEVKPLLLGRARITIRAADSWGLDDAY